MSSILALVEGILMFVAVGAGLAAGEAGPWPSRIDLVAPRALSLVLGGLFAFHFNDLYELRRVWAFDQFVHRFPKALAMMFVLGGAVNLTVPGLSTPWTSLVVAVFGVGVLVLPLRFVLHRLFAGHPFSRRILVLGTTELAGKVVQEILAEPDLRDV